MANQGASGLSGFSTARIAQNPKDLLSIDLNYLIPNVASPCSIYLYFKGSFIQRLSPGEVVELPLFERLKGELCALGFIEKKERPLWEKWKEERHPHEGLTTVFDLAKVGQTSKASSRARTVAQEFASYAISKIEYKAKTDVQQRVVTLTEQLLRETALSPVLEWYFHRSDNLESSVFYHCARVTYLGLLFSATSVPSLPEPFLKQFCFSSILHELEGDPAKAPASGFHSGRALEIIQSEGHVISSEITDVIHQQDEFFDGSGLPKKSKGNEICFQARVFSLVNIFDHLRLMYPGGTRRVRFERTRGLMEKRMIQFDPMLWQLFWPFMENTEILE